MTERTRTIGAAVLCALMIAVCLAVLAFYLFSDAPSAIIAPAQDDTLGMVLINIPDEEAAAFYHVNHFGVYVLAVDAQSDAYEYGVRSGDRMVSINGAAIRNTADVSVLRERLITGDRMEITFHRGPENQLLTAAFLHDSVAE